MKLYQSINGSMVIFSDDMTFAYEHKGVKYYTEDNADSKLDDGLSDVEFYTEVDSNDMAYYVAWCKQERLDPKQAVNISEYGKWVQK